MFRVYYKNGIKSIFIIELKEIVRVIILMI